jgi:hypothetical protein
MRQRANVLKLSAVTLLFALLVMLTGCQRGSYAIQSGKIDRKGKVYSGEYKRFNGFKSYSLGKARNITINYTITTKAGELRVDVLNENEQVVSSVTQQKEGQLTALVDKEQKLLLRIEGVNHQGMFHLEVIP